MKYRAFFAVFLAGCLPACSNAVYDGSGLLQADRTSVVLGDKARLDRLEQCAHRYEHYRSENVWLTGGGNPEVSPAAWDALSAADQNEIFDLAACIGQGGATGSVKVTILYGGRSTPIESRIVANDKMVLRGAI